MIKLNGKTVSRTVAVVLIILFVWYFFANIKDFSLLLGINPIFIIFLVMIYVLTIFTNGLFLKISTSLFDKRIRIGESVKMSLVSSAGNFFAPAGSGLGLRAIYLKKSYGLSYSDYVSIVLCNYILVLFVNSILGLISLFMLDSFARPGSVILGIFFVVLIVASIGTLFIRFKKVDVSTTSHGIKWIKVVFSVFVKISSGWTIIIKNKKVALRLFVVVVVNTCLITLGTYFIMSSLGIILSLAGVLLFSVLGALSLFINITPGNLGIKEAVFIAFSSIIGLTTPQILSAALIDRAVTFIVLLLLWIAYGKSIYASMSTESHAFDQS